jgi:predicted transcriptional regulator of viral defense system
MACNALTKPAGISAANRAHLEALHRIAEIPFSVDDAAAALDLTAPRAAQLLGYLARRGWLSRVRRGLYVAVPLEARRSGEWTADPWLIAEKVFSPCYVGGWSACEYWDLTEQLFRSVLVVTARRPRNRDVDLNGVHLHVVSRNPNLLFGTTEIWRGQSRVSVSDPSRTVVDLLDAPALGGGIRTVADVLGEYMSSQHRDDQRLVNYGDRLPHRAMFKRLGFLLEQSEFEAPELLEACRTRRTAGLISLDPAIKASGRIAKRWGLRMNVGLPVADP